MIKNKKIFFYFTVLLFLIGNSFGLNINIYGEIDEYSKVYKESIYVNLNCGEVLNLSLPYNFKNGYLMEKSISNNSIFLENCNSTNIISYTLNKLEVLNSGQIRIERNFLSYKNINYTYSLFIPIDFQINQNETIPHNFNTIFNNNKKLVNFQKNEIYIIYVEEVMDDSPVSIAHFKKEFEEPTTIILMLITFLIGILLTFIYFNNYRKIEVSETVPSFVLSKEEKDILDVIRNNPGINQKLIGVELNFSKARVSMFINELEQKKLVKRERFGRSFKVYIEKKVI